MKRLAIVCLSAAALAVAVPALAFQTIVLDGVNDFAPAAQIDADGGDTQFGPLDLGNIYLENDGTYLYFGFQYDTDGWCDNNIGIAIDVKNTPAGGTADAFTRKLAWNTVPFKPDFYLYDVVPTGCNSYNYEVLYSWSGSGWSTVQDGPDGLGIVDGLFSEGRIALSTLGVGPGDVINVEFWMTQEGAQKGPLDASCSDAVQLSTPGNTIWDVNDPVEMTCMHRYTIQAPPVPTERTTWGAIKNLYE